MKCRIRSNYVREKVWNCTGISPFGTDAVVGSTEMTRARGKDAWRYRCVRVIAGALALQNSQQISGAPRAARNHSVERQLGAAPGIMPPPVPALRGLAAPPSLPGTSAQVLGNKESATPLLQPQQLGPGSETVGFITGSSPFPDIGDDRNVMYLLLTSLAPVSMRRM
jgi:hypothetical protein